MTPELEAELEGEFLTAIAKQSNEILKCAMYLFPIYLPGHAEAEAVMSRFLGVAKKMKMTAASPTAA